MIAKSRRETREPLYTANNAMAKARLLLIISSAAVTVLMTLLAGCSQTSTPKDGTQEYQATGQVVALDPAAQTAKVRAEKIEGWMDAMTMEFPVKDKQEFEKLKIGETIQAKVMVEGANYWLAGITEAGASPSK